MFANKLKWRDLFSFISVIGKIWKETPIWFYQVISPSPWNLGRVNIALLSVHTHVFANLILSLKEKNRFI